MKKNIFLSILLGALTALFLFFISLNIEISLPFNFGFLFFILPILAALGILLGEFLGRINLTFKQLIKFAEAGVLSTAIDFGVLNLLILLTNITKGGGIIIINSIAFSVAFLNSYFWNKFWTFKQQNTDKNVWLEFMQFFIISVIGIGINSGIVFTITTFIKPIGALSPELWVNIAKIAATLASLVWNFSGYKFIVFKKNIKLVP